MKNLRKLGAAFALTTVIAGSAFAGQILTPCSQTDPGQILTPCDPGSPAAPGDMTPGSSSTASAGLNMPTVAHESSFSKIAADVLLNLLPLF
jgi:hypothetical protein